ncbi:MAG: 4Fe-4S cluster-binding domain-containing protein, partial [Muribaculaceae bacterium]|nr:4Fe-4S cluster-binding domain-containing protein [Muribaculaceae bacterium]
MNYLRVLDIVEGTSVDGPGLRTSIYLAGCAHHCQGCHNPESWDFNGGNELDDDRLMEVIAYNDFNVTFSGGDPMGQPEALARLCRRIKAELGKTIWVYT